MSWQQIEIDTQSSEQTEAVAEAIGRRLRGGEVIELVSDLGGGKTTWVRGLARAAGSSDVVASPTFTISKLYTTPKLQIHHFDFYRLAEAGIMSQEVAELLTDKQNVIIVEWSDIVQNVLPAERVKVVLERVKSGEDHRRLSIRAHEHFAYLLEDLR